jgi:hypothetical protein
MKKIDISALTGSKVYFTEADSFSQINYNVSSDELLLKLKLSLLLSDNIILAANHIFESQITFNVLKENPILLESGVVIPDLRDECRDFLDFIEIEKEQGDLPKLYRRKEKQFKDIAFLLHDHVPQVVLWAAAPTSTEFRQTLVNDLLNKDSPLRKKLIGIRKDLLTKLVWEIGNTQLLTREKIFTLSDRYLSNKKEVLKRYADIMYYLSGAAHLKSEPVIHPTAVNWCVEKFFNISNNLKARIGEHEAFHILLDKLTISTSVLDKLAVSELIKFREEDIAKKFRHKWHKIIDQAKRTGKVEKKTDSYYQMIINIFEEISKIISVEKTRKTSFEKARKILMLSSIVTSMFATFITNPALGIGSLFIELASIDPLLASIERKWGGMELTVFCSRVQQIISSK